MMKLGKTLAVGVMLSLAACGGGDAGKMTKIKDEICACKDLQCVSKVEKDNEDFKKSMMEKFKDVKDPKDLPKDLMEAVMEIDECRRKIRKDEREKARGDKSDKSDKGDKSEDRASMKSDRKSGKKADEDKVDDKKTDDAKGDDTKAASGGGDASGVMKEMLAIYSEYKDKVCACKELMCTVGLTKEMGEKATKLSGEMMKLAGKVPSAADAAITQEITAATQAAGECVKKLAGS
jgi:hypothetical protein